jgi:hypothetical protein
MQRTITLGMIAVTLFAGTSWADFKYTQQSKATGGTLVTMTKTLGVFSKSARQITEPTLSTTMIKGNSLRTEQSNSTIEIIDLDGRRFIHIDPAKKAYSIVTFDQFKQQIQQAQEKAKAEQTKSATKQGNAQNVQMVPKFDAQATGATRTVLNVPAKEMKMRVDILFKSTDPKTEADLEKSNASYWMTSDGWYGTVPGYDEVRKFYMKMAKELDWLPGQIGMGNPQMSQAMDEFRKNAIKMDGMPLLQYTSFGMAATAQPGQSETANAQGATSQQQTAQTSSDNNTPTSAKEAIGKSLGGMFGGFGKKKKQEQPPESSVNSGAAGGGTASSTQPTTVKGSMMDMTVEITSYSNNGLDASLFEIPAGYTQVQQDLNGR